MTPLNIACFETQCWNDYLAACCGCCCECNWSIFMFVDESCGVAGGTIHYTIDGGSEQTETDSVSLDYSENRTICAWFEPDDPESTLTISSLDCLEDPCGSCTHAAADCVEYITDTISFSTTCDPGGNCICDSANQFIAQGFVAGMGLCVEGSSNFNDSDFYADGYCRIASVTAGKICLEEFDEFGNAFQCQNAFNPEAAGATITLTGIDPDVCVTYICVEGCGQIPDDADVDLTLNLDMSGTCVDDGSCLFTPCDKWEMTSFLLGSCSGSVCTSVGSEFLTEGYDLCNSNTFNPSFTGLDATTLQSSFCLEITTEWWNCDTGCDIEFDQDFGIELEYFGGLEGSGVVLISFDDVGEPPCEIIYCIPACGFLSYTNTADAFIMSIDEMNPTCIEVSCGTTAEEPAPLLVKQGNKVFLNKNQYTIEQNNNKKKTIKLTKQINHKHGKKTKARINAKLKANKSKSKTNIKSQSTKKKCGCGKKSAARQNLKNKKKKD